MSPSSGEPEPEPGGGSASCPLCKGAVPAGESAYPREMDCPGCGHTLWFAGRAEAEAPYAVVNVEPESLDLLDERAMGIYIVEVMDAPARVAVDVSRTSATTSVGIARLLRLNTRLKRASVSMRLRGVQPFLRKTLTMVGLDKVFPLDEIR